MSDGITIMPPDGEVVQKFGLVAVMDVLGVRNDDVGQSCRLLEKIQAYKTRCRDFRNDHCWKTLRDKIPPKEYDNWDLIFKKESSLDVFFLGDTFVFAFPFPKDYHGNPGRLVRNGLHLANYFFTLAFEYDLFMRGACAIGDFLWADESTVLGPAITDAINWHDKADWIGLHLTPTAAIHYQRHCRDIEFLPGARPLLYPVPFKQGARPMFTVNWTSYTNHQFDECFDEENRFRKDNLKILFWDIICKHGIIPYGVESKYENTLTFFEAGLDAFEKEHKQFQAEMVKGLSRVCPEDTSAPK